MSQGKQNKQRELRVFFSSTFKDMAIERDYLQSHVFPRIERICIQRRVQFTPIDLRWGITENEAREGHVVRICLEEIDRCIPFFIGFIGERYGWAPKPEDIHNFNELSEIFSELRALKEAPISITEMEMLHGALEAKQEVQSAFFFRDHALTSLLAKDVNHQDYFEFDPIAQKRLITLREMIESSPSPVFKYKAIEEFGESVEATLMSMIEENFPLDEYVDELMIQHGLHLSMTEKLSRYYLVPSLVSELSETLSNGDPSLHILCSKPGEGRSAAVAYLKGELERSNILSLAHYVKLDDRPSPEVFIKRMCELLCTLLEVERETSESIDEYTDLLFDLMEEWHFESDQYLVILIDDVDLWNDGEWGSALQWLPPELPMGMSIVMTCSQPSYVDLIKEHASELTPQLHSLNPLTNEDIEQFSERYLATFRKKLSPTQLEQIVIAPIFANAQALKIMLDELRTYGHFEGLDDVIARGANCADISALSLIHLEPLEQSFSESLVKRIFTVLSATIHGISELDLAAYLGTTQMTLSRIVLSSAAHIETMSGRLQLAHSYIRTAVNKRYGIDEQRLNKERLTLARWLNDRAVSFERTIEQLKLYDAINDKEGTLATLSDLERTEQLIGTREWFQFWKDSGEASRSGELYLDAFTEYGIEISSLDVSLENFDAQFSKGAQKHSSLDEELAQHASPLITTAWSLALYIAELGDKERALRLALWSYQHLHLLEQDKTEEELNIISQELMLATLFKQNLFFDRSVNLFERVRERTYNQHQIPYLEATHNLALALQEANRWDRVEGYLTECVHAYSEIYSNENPVTLTASLNLANFYHDVSRYQEAIEISENTLEIFKRRQGVHHVSTLSLSNNLALTYNSAGQHDKAMALLNECYNALLERYGANHPKTLQTLSNITNVQALAGEVELVTQTSVALLEQQRQQLGEMHLDTLMTMYNVALLKKAEGEIEEAVEMLEQVNQGRLKQLGPDHVETLVAQSELAEALCESDEFDRGCELRRKVLEQRRILLGDEHFDTLHSFNLVAIEHAINEDFDEAISLFDKAYQGRRTLLGDGHQVVMDSAFNLSKALYQVDRFDEAEEIIRLQTDNAFASDNPPLIACSLHLQLLEMYVYEERDEAWAHFEQHLEYLGHTNIFCSEEYFEGWSEAVNHIGDLDHERAAGLIKQWAKDARKELGDDQLRLGNLCRALSESLQELDEDELALPYHLELLTISNSLFGKTDEITLRVKYALGELYETLEERDKSECLYREVIEQLRTNPIEDEDLLLEIMVTLGHLLFEIKPNEVQERRELFREVEKIRLETLYDEHFEIALIQAQLGWELLIDGELKQAHNKYKSFRNNDELEELMELGFIEEWEFIWLKLGLGIINAERANKNQRKSLVKSARKKLKQLIEELGDDHPRVILAKNYIPK